MVAGRSIDKTLMVCYNGGKRCGRECLVLGFLPAPYDRHNVKESVNKP